MIELSKRERQTLSLLALPDKEIARRLSISNSAVAHYTTSLFCKLAPTDNRTQTLIIALKKGLITLDEIVLE